MLRISDLEHSEMHLKTLTQDEAKKVVGGSLIFLDENGEVLGYTCLIVRGKLFCPLGKRKP